MGTEQDAAPNGGPATPLESSGVTEGPPSVSWVVGQLAWKPSLAGILERKQQIKERIHMIAKFHKTDRGLVLAVSLLAGLALVTLTDAQVQTTPQRVKVGEPDAAKGVWVVRFEPVGDFALIAYTVLPSPEKLTEFGYQPVGIKPTTWSPLLVPLSATTEMQFRLPSVT